jgi:hypothetical protein
LITFYAIGDSISLYINKTLSSATSLSLPDATLSRTTTSSQNRTADYNLISVQFTSGVEVEVRNFGEKLSVVVWVNMQKNLPTVALDGGLCGMKDDTSQLNAQSDVDSYGNQCMLRR